MRYPKTTSAVHHVWQRVLARKPLTAADFAIVARWAHRHIPEERRVSALFDLFERCADGEAA